MSNPQSETSGFDPHVQQQLQEMAASTRSQQHNQQPQNRGRGQGRRGRGRGYQPFANSGYDHRAPRPPVNGMMQHTQNSNWKAPAFSSNDANSFPPLGSSRPAPPPVQPQQVNATTAPIPVHANQSSQHTPGDQFARGRGGFQRGRGTFHRQNNQNFVAPNAQMPVIGSDFNRPPPNQNNRLYQPNMHVQSLSTESDAIGRHQIMSQSDFLTYLANRNLKNQITPEEQQEKEAFRKELQSIVQAEIGKATPPISFSPDNVKLKIYGSLGSGFGVAGCDMDILLAFPQDQGPLGDIEIDSRRMFEKALLNVGYGARLLTNTRVPILRVCQKPSAELLENLRENRREWEMSLKSDKSHKMIDLGFGGLPEISAEQMEASITAMNALDVDAVDIPLPKSPVPENAKLEFVGDCGIQCDINFSNYVALHNTRLLYTYGMCDVRVRQVGLFVKTWAKARDINTPYRGTLSSYGYILMVLHYLMNVVRPPLIPNLQVIAKDRDDFMGSTDVSLVEGCDVRFVRDMQEVKEIMQTMRRNHESLGQLLRGFFFYYANPQGFHWSNAVISIRTKGGFMQKRTKGWTAAKWSEGNQNVRLRYLFAIEDPFELDHNVARTVGHHGICAIRDEFRRAWSMIHSIQADPETRSWFYISEDGSRTNGESLMETNESRGDLLRKDQDSRRQKAQQMREELEAKEKALKDERLSNAADHEEVKNIGTSSYAGAFQSPAVSRNVSSDLTLTHHQTSQKQRLQQRSKPSRRVVEHNDSDDDDTENGDTQDDIKAERPSSSVMDSSMVRDVASTRQHVGGNAWDAGNSLQDHDTRMPSNTVQPEQHVREVEAKKHRVSARNHTPWLRSATQNGRWLDWRDDQIRAGKWNELRRISNRRFRLLHENFPYNPNMTESEKVQERMILQNQFQMGGKKAPTQVESQHGLSSLGPVLSNKSSNTSLIEAGAGLYEEFPFEVELVRRKRLEYFAYQFHAPHEDEGSAVSTVSSLTASSLSPRRSDKAADVQAVIDLSRQRSNDDRMNFRLDPRQLADIETIKHGGNGCARQGDLSVECEERGDEEQVDALSS